MNLAYISLSILVICSVAQSQIVIDSSPSSVTIVIQETSVLTLDMDSNSINGASGVLSFDVASNSPNNPTWMAIAGYTLTFTPSLISHTGVYDVQFEVVETGTGACTFVPHNRRLTVIVSKNPPVVGYNIPDYNSLRAGVAFDITFPQAAGVDVHGDTLDYNLLDQNDLAVTSNINYDFSGTGRIYGTIPNSHSGTYLLRLLGKDSQNQSIQQDFTMYFAANNNPYQIITDLTPYTFDIPQGMNSTFVIPTGIYLDADGDTINYELGFFENFAALSTVGWATFYPGFEGVSYLEFIEPLPTTHTGINLMLSDGISSTTGPVLISFTFNDSPITSTNPLDITIYPNSTFTQQIDLSTYFTDPENQPLSFSSHTHPSEVSITEVSSPTFQIDADFSSSFPASDLTFYFSASDGASKPTDMQVNLKPSTCTSECGTCFGPTISEGYSGTGSYVLLDTTCQSNCPDGKYANNGVGTDCQTNCESCTQSGCTRCDSSYYMKSGLCESDCGTGFFGYDRECFEGSDGCDHCSGELATEGTIGSDGYMFVDHV